MNQEGFLTWEPHFGRRSAHMFRCFLQSAVTAIGRIARSRIGSRPRLTRGRNRIASWMYGASRFGIMICVTRARLTWRRRESLALSHGWRASKKDRCSQGVLARRPRDRFPSTAAS